MSIHPLRAFRKSEKLTRNQLAGRLGVSPALVTLIELGRKRVTPKNALAWEKIIPITKESLCPEVFGAGEQKAA